MQEINRRKYMGTKHFSLLVFLTLMSVIYCRAEQLTDSQLLEISQKAFELRKAVKNQNLAKEAIREGMANLSDAEKTRAMALRIFDLDAKDNGRMRFNAPSSIQNVLMNDPSLITDSKELEAMIARETNARKFFILASMASHFMDTQKSDFVVEMAPMLFRHEPLAKMSVDSEYYFEGLSDASFFAYGMIVRNLKILNADFIPADNKLPYPDKISILVKWLKENYPGCEQLGDTKTTTQDLRINANEKPEVREAKRISAPSEDQSPTRTSSGMPWWQLSVAATVLIVVLGIWLKLKSPTTPL
jgi:hypothetical protein